MKALNIAEMRGIDGGYYYCYKHRTCFATKLGYLVHMLINRH